MLIDNSHDDQIMICVLTSGPPMIGRFSIVGPGNKTYKRDGHNFKLIEPFGIMNKKPSPGTKLSPDEMPYLVLDMLTLGATREIVFHEDAVLYMYPASNEIIDQYNTILDHLGRLADPKGSETI